MKCASGLLSTVGIAGLLTLPIGLFAQAPLPVPPPATQPMAQNVPAPGSPAVQAVLQAPDPSSAIEAYARGRATVGESTALMQAYVQRMVSFGLPEMADVQARQLLLQEPNNGLALAVEAYMSGKRGLITQALGDIVRAVQADSQNPFVLGTAGQLIAYYDTAADQSRVPLDLRKQIERLHRTLDDKSAFTKAYTAARQMYQQGREQTANPQYYQQNAPPATQPQSGQTQQGAEGRLDNGPYSTYLPPTYIPPTEYNTYNYYGNNPDYYYPSGYYGNYYYQYPWYPSYYWGVGAGWWWPSGAIIINYGKYGHGYYHRRHYPYYYPYYHRGRYNYPYYHRYRGLGDSLYYHRYHRYPHLYWRNTIRYRPGYVPPRSRQNPITVPRGYRYRSLPNYNAPNNPMNLSPYQQRQIQQRGQQHQRQPRGLHDRSYRYSPGRSQGVQPRRWQQAPHGRPPSQAQPAPRQSAPPAYHGGGSQRGGGSRGSGHSGGGGRR